MLNWIAVAAGGAVGSCLRYGLARVLAGTSYPYATQLANVLGSLLIGMLVVIIFNRVDTSHPLYHLLIVGLLGGFTTYSGFSLDAMRLIEQGRIGVSLLYIGSTVGLCIAAAALGLMLGRRLM